MTRKRASSVPSCLLLGSSSFASLPSLMTEGITQHNMEVKKPQRQRQREQNDRLRYKKCSERRRPFGTGLVRHCPQGLFSPFFTFLRAIFFRPFSLSLAPTICPWVSEDEFWPNYFFKMVNLFSLSGKLFVMWCIVFVSQWKLSFLTPVKWLSNRASCTCFRSPTRKKPY